MNSRRKGKVGEREFAALLREHGFDARRGVQFAGGADSPDVVSEALRFLHIEVKRTQALNLVDACAQAEGDCGGKPWIVAHRRNRKPWFITMDADTGYRFLLWGDSPSLALSQAANPWPLTVEADLFLQFLRRECEPRMDGDKCGCGGHEEHLTPSPSPQRGEGGSEIPA